MHLVIFLKGFSSFFHGGGLIRFFFFYGEAFFYFYFMEGVCWAQLISLPPSKIYCMEGGCYRLRSLSFFPLQVWRKEYFTQTDRRTYILTDEHPIVLRKNRVGTGSSLHLSSRKICPDNMADMVLKLSHDHQTVKVSQVYDTSLSQLLLGIPVIAGFSPMNNTSMPPPYNEFLNERDFLKGIEIYVSLQLCCRKVTLN